MSKSLYTPYRYPHVLKTTHLSVPKPRKIHEVSLATKIGRVRSTLYKTARFLGDVQAVVSPKHGTIVKRVERRIVGRWLSKNIMRKI